MKRLLSCCVGVAAGMTLLAHAHAGPNMPTTLVYELPDADLSFFGTEFVDTFAAPTVANIIDARLILQYTTGPNLDAEDIVIEITAPNGTVWLNTGADLGFFGMGTFITGISSSVFDGVYDVPASDAFFTVRLRTSPAGMPLDGQFTDSSVDIDVQPAQAADLNDDGVVNGKDLAMLLANWGECVGPCRPDLNLDGFVNGADLALLLAVWG